MTSQFDTFEQREIEFVAEFLGNCHATLYPAPSLARSEQIGSVYSRWDIAVCAATPASSSICISAEISQSVLSSVRQASAEHEWTGTKRSEIGAARTVQTSEQDKV